MANPIQDKVWIFSAIFFIENRKWNALGPKNRYLFVTPWCLTCDYYGTGKVSKFNLIWMKFLKRNLIRMSIRLLHWGPNLINYMYAASNDVWPFSQNIGGPGPHSPYWSTPIEDKILDNEYSSCTYDINWKSTIFLPAIFISFPRLRVLPFQL